jgi:hypothetical protein
MKNGKFYGHLVYFVAIWNILWRHFVYFTGICYILWWFWYIFPVFGMLYQEKSGNPVVDCFKILYLKGTLPQLLHFWPTISELHSKTIHFSFRFWISSKRQFNGRLRLRFHRHGNDSRPRCPLGFGTLQIIFPQIFKGHFWMKCNFTCIIHYLLHL